MLFLAILFYIFGAGFLAFGLSLTSTGYVTHQTLKYLIFIMSILCISTGSIMLALRKVLISLQNFHNEIKFKLSNNNSNNTTIISSNKHRWLCPSCNKLISEYPCIFCGINPEESKPHEILQNQ